MLLFNSATLVSSSHVLLSLVATCHAIVRMLHFLVTCTHVHIPCGQAPQRLTRTRAPTLVPALISVSVSSTEECSAAFAKSPFFCFSELFSFQVAQRRNYDFKFCLWTKTNSISNIRCIRFSSSAPYQLASACALYNVHCTSARCMLFQCALYTVSLCTLHCIGTLYQLASAWALYAVSMCSVHCINVHCTLYQCTICCISVHSLLYQCALYTVSICIYNAQ